MTIFFFTGTPGSGKTYEAVEKILNNLRLGKCVYTNIDGMDDPHCQETLKVLAGLDDLQFGHQFHHLGNNREVIENFWEHCPERNSLIVLDEVQKFFNNRDWQMPKNRLFGDWASTHRHNGYDLVIITQNAERIDAAVRSLTEWNYCFRKINFFGSLIQKGYLCNIYAGEDTSGQPLKRANRRYHSQIFSCYQSYAAKDIKEQSIMPTVNVLKHPVFFAIPVVLCFTIYMIFFKSSLGTGDIFGTKKIQQKALAVIDAPEAKASTPPSLPNAGQGLSVASASHPSSPISADQSVPAPSFDVADSVPTPQPITHRIKLNYAEYTREGRVQFRFMFRGQIYNFDTFPYPITAENGRLYADIPEPDLPPAKAS